MLFASFAATASRRCFFFLLNNRSAIIVASAKTPTTLPTVAPTITPVEILWEFGFGDDEEEEDVKA